MSHSVVCRYHYRGKFRPWLYSVTVWLFSREGVAKSPCKCGSGAEIYSGDARISHDRFMECILLFESDREHLHFNEYARRRWKEKEKYEQNIWLPYFPELKDYNMDYFKEVYVNSQILQRMLAEYRAQA